jgi:hypothetical protein
MNIQKRILFTRWVLRWVTWQRGEPYFCIGFHVHPRGMKWNWERRLPNSWSPIDGVTIHLGPLAVLLTKTRKEG